MKTLSFLLFFLHSIIAAALTIDVSVNRDPVDLNDPFVITFTANGTPDGDPDFSPLNQNFDIISQSQSKQASWINGHSTETIQWRLELMAKQVGNVLIPAISFGANMSNPLKLSVLKQSTVNNNIDTNQDLFLKVEATPQDPYIQAQVIYTMRLYRRVDLAQATLNDPSLNDAIVQKLGDDSNYTTNIKGIDYAVTERKYAMFPQKSGHLTIPPLKLSAEVIAARQSGNFSSFFNQSVTQTRHISSDALTLNVRPMPGHLKTSHWLPAESLQLKQEWSGDINKMNVGEPLTRTVTVQAKGATVGVLPELHTPSTTNEYKSYPDQPNSKEVAKPDGIYAWREEKIAIIPGVAGKITLPAIEVAWFNTKTQQVQTSNIPATTLNVSGSASSTAMTVSPSKTEITSSSVNAPLTITSGNTNSSDRWLIWLALLLGSGWIPTLLYLLYRQRQTQSKVQTEATNTEAKPINYQQQLKRACQDHDQALAQLILLNWGYATFKANSLGALATHCNARLHDEIMQLNQRLYSPKAADTPWEGKRLLQAFNEQTAMQKFQAPVEDTSLEPLYRL